MSLEDRLSALKEKWARAGGVHRGFDPLRGWMTVEARFPDLPLLAALRLRDVEVKDVLDLAALDLTTVRGYETQDATFLAIADARTTAYCDIVRHGSDVATNPALALLHKVEANRKAQAVLRRVGEEL